MDRRGAAVLIGFVVAIGMWVRAGTVGPCWAPSTQDACGPREWARRPGLLEGWPELQREGDGKMRTGVDAVSVVERARRDEGTRLLCGDVVDGRLLYCGLCLKCGTHCQCSEQKRMDAWTGYLITLADKTLLEKRTDDRFKNESVGRGGR